MHGTALGLLLYYALTILMVLVLASIVLSWFPPGGETMRSIQNVVYRSTDWMIAPVRRVLPPLRLGGMALDLSPLVVLLVISILRSVVA